MRSPQKLAEDYIEVWNERDTQRRHARLAATWTEDAVYVDPLMRGDGRPQISDLIGAVHERFPGFRFSLLGAADGYGDVVRFSWGLGPDGGEAVVKGTDFVRRASDQIASVTGFIDQLPT
jgi:SnoaL-like protein